VSLDDITSVDISLAKRRRVGRGLGSGLGKTGGRGGKGEGSRTGGTNRGPMFEGGQFPFWKRLPYRGFTNFAHKVVYQAVDLGRALERVEGNEITLETLAKAGLTRQGQLVKLLGKTEVSKPVKVVVNRVSASVRQAIEAAGGSVTELNAPAAQA